MTANQNRADRQAATFGRLIGSELAGETPPSVVLTGFPSDEGVRRNRGRPGASLAPDAIREALYALTVEDSPALRTLIGYMKDLGNVRVSGDVETDQANLAAAVRPWLALGTIPIILGGGHETAYGHFLAYAAAAQDVAILNWDAHPDVRPLTDGKGHSGSPFRQAILHESGRCRNYQVAGLLPARLVPEHLEFITQHHGKYYWRSELPVESIDRIYLGLPLFGLMISFDMDAVDRAFAPGVSAPAEGGLTADLWLHAARMAGRHARSLDLVEVNPKFDLDGRTLHLAGETVLAFLRGIADRSSLACDKA